MSSYVGPAVTTTRVPFSDEAGGSTIAGGGLDDLRRLGQSALPDPAAGEIALSRLDEPHAARGQRLQIPLHRLVRQHVDVHRRRDEHGRLRRQIQRRQKVVGNPVGELADHVGGTRCHQQQRDAVGDRNVLDVGVHARPPLRGDDRTPGDRLERDRPDEPRRRSRHNRDDVVAALLEPAAHFDRLVGSNSAGDAQRDQCHRQTSSSIFSTFRRRTSRWAMVTFLSPSSRGTAPAQQLTRPRAGQDDEFEPVLFGTAPSFKCSYDGFGLRPHALCPCALCGDDGLQPLDRRVQFVVDDDR